MQQPEKPWNQDNNNNNNQDNNNNNQDGINHQDGINYQNDINPQNDINHQYEMVQDERPLKRKSPDSPVGTINAEKRRRNQVYFNNLLKKQSNPVNKIIPLKKDKSIEKDESIEKKNKSTKTTQSVERIEHYMITKRKVHIEMFIEDDFEQSDEFIKPDNTRYEYTKKHLMALNFIIVWINMRLIDMDFNKQMAGIYLWSYKRSNGKTLFCNVLSKIFRMYKWVFEDDEWQQDWIKDDENPYKCIIYNALNSALLKFRQIEMHGDREEITVRKRNQKFCDHIKKDTPFIITSNKPAEKLGYEDKDLEIKIWKERSLIICLDNCPIFPLIKRISKLFNVRVDREAPIPEYIDVFEI